MKRFHIYISNLSKQDMVPISSLSEAVYGTDASTIADLHDMIADRLFLQGHVDRKKNIFTPPTRRLKPERFRIYRTLRLMTKRRRLRRWRSR